NPWGRVSCWPRSCPCEHRMNTRPLNVTIHRSLHTLHPNLPLLFLMEPSLFLMEWFLFQGWCLVKDLGFALVGVPTGPDHIIFNVHRVYGPLMYSHLFANWQQVYTNTDMSLFTSEGHRRNVRKGGYLQTVHLLRKNIALFNL
ncbi:hypothetical protein TCAL_15162, partial [Tigriopus californicus]